MMMDEKRPLPEGWVWKTLGEVARINYRDPKLRELPDDFEVTFLPMAAVDEVQGRIAAPQVRKIGEVRKGYTPFSEGDVLFAKITPSMENGKAAIARPLRNGVGFGSTEFHVISPKPEALAEYLFYFVRQITFREDAKANFSGTAGQLRVGKDFLEAYEIPLAPLAEQKQIVSEIEKQFTRLDAAVSALRRVQGNVARYKAAVLKAACEGRLVPQDPNDEPASELLARISAERRRQWEQSGKKGKYREPVGVDVDAAELPEGWVWARFDQLLLELKNGYFSKAPENEPPGIPILRISAVRPLSVDISQPRYLRENMTPRLEEYLLKPNDLLFTRYNGNLRYVGVCGVVQTVQHRTLYPDKLIRVRVPTEFVQPSYLEIYFATQSARRYVESVAKSTAGQHGISGEQLRNCPVVLPPMTEQKRIAEEVERRLSVVQAVEWVIEANLARAERLRQGILQRAFSGRLV